MSPFTATTQLTLIGLAAKNAILIVEYAKLRRDEGMSIYDAAIEAAHPRLRPILMTSFAFILGLVPLLIASGAGAASRRALGTAVFGGLRGHPAGRICCAGALLHDAAPSGAAESDRLRKSAFREVSDALIGYRMTREQRAQQELLVKALVETDRLSRLRYEGDLDSYLQGLDADRNLFQGELLQSQLRGRNY